jgi:hypothetical protein
VLVARRDARAEREHERVVFVLLPVLGVGHAQLVVDPPELVAHELGADVLENRLERVVAGAEEGEGLAHGHRAVDEVLVGGDHGHLHAVVRELLQRERRLERRDAAARDQHPELL